MCLLARCYSAPSEPPAVIRGGGKWNERVENQEREEEGRERKDVKG